MSRCYLCDRAEAVTKDAVGIPLCGDCGRKYVRRDVEPDAPIDRAPPLKVEAHDAEGLFLEGFGR